MTSEAFVTLPERIQRHSETQPDKLAITDGILRLNYAELNRAGSQIAAALQRDGIAQGQTVALVSSPSIAQAAMIIGALRAGAVPALIQPSATPEQVAGMVADSDAQIVFLGDSEAAALANRLGRRRVVISDEINRWLDGVNTPKAVRILPSDAFNIIYSSGTTGAPKGIVVSHAMRADQFASYAELGYADATTMIATPLYSSTTMVVFLPTLAYGGSVVLMRRFDPCQYLDMAQRYSATHTMLVPVQYQRIMTLPNFDRYNLSSFQWKFCTSSPFCASLKADVLRRWPGKLVEFYGMTEGGGSTVLWASERPDKLHTVGVPAPGHEIRLIDADGRELAAGAIGEVVSRSGAMMSGYHGRSDATADVVWTSPDGGRFIRHGDVGCLDSDGFLILIDRSKDVIISGGFNIYPSDLEAALMQQPGVVECAVVGMPSERWGETPVGFYVPSVDVTVDKTDLLEATNARLGRTQRLSALHAVPELPRNAIGKVLKRQLRELLTSKSVSS